MSGGHYLLIEDDDIDALITNSMLNKQYPLLACKRVRNGEEALGYLTKCSERQIPDFILLDLIMPLHDGFDFLKDYDKKIYLRFPKLPIVVLSCSIHNRDREVCVRYPFIKGYIIKPFDIDILIGTGIV